MKKEQKRQLLSIRLGDSYDMKGNQNVTSSFMFGARPHHGFSIYALYSRTYLSRNYRICCFFQTEPETSGREKNPGILQKNLYVRVY